MPDVRDSVGQSVTKYNCCQFSTYGSVWLLYSTTKNCSLDQMIRDWSLISLWAFCETQDVKVDVVDDVESAWSASMC